MTFRWLERPKELEPFTKEVSANPPIEALEEDLKEVPEDFGFFFGFIFFSRVAFQ